MTALVVVPVVTRPRPNIVASWTHPEHCIVVNGDHDHWHDLAAKHPHWHVIDDHGTTNRGCPASWNRGFELADALGHRHVVIMSQSMLLHHGTAAFVARIPDHIDIIGTGHQTFHCIAIAVDLWQRVGGFDETFPIWADADFHQRTHPFAPSNLQLDIAATTERCIAVRTGHATEADYHADQARFTARYPNAQPPAPANQDGRQHFPHLRAAQSV
jgi:hypothetical protein